MWSKVRRVARYVRYFSSDAKQYSAAKSRVAYKPPPVVKTIIKSNTNEMFNQGQKDHFHSYVKQAASGLHRNLDRESAKVKSETRRFMKDICHTLDQTSLSIFIKYLDQLQSQLKNPDLKTTPNSFLTFLDSLKSMGISRGRNPSQLETLNVVLKYLSGVNIKELNKHEILREYQKLAQESKAEEQLRLHEIRQFADDVVPRTRFIFDNYNLEPQKSADKKQTNYFSFFEEEKKVLKPQENFQNIEEMMSFLPLDYYVLLETGYERVKNAVPPRSNFIYFKNLPLLYRKRSVMNNFKVFRAVFGDVLTPSFFESPHFSLQPSVDIMRFSLQLYFGKVRSQRIFNFSHDSLRKRVEKLKNQASQTNLEDQITQFQNLYSSLFEKEVGAARNQFPESQASFSHFTNFSKDQTGRIEYQAKSFEQLLKVVAKNWEGGEQASQMSRDSRFVNILQSPTESYREASLLQKKSEGMIQRQMRYPPQLLNSIRNNLNHKIRSRYGLDKPILANGVIEFESYESKLKMLLSPLYKFGKFQAELGLYHFFNNIEFFDCDFANVIQVKAASFEKKTLGECLFELNEMLKQGGYRQMYEENSEFLTLGNLKHYPDFRLADIQVNSQQPVLLRFKSFENAHRGFKALLRAKKNREIEEFKATIQTPYIRYYGGQFQTQFEKCIQDRFEGLDHTFTLRSDYVQKQSRVYFGDDHSITEEFYDKMQEAQRLSDLEGGGPILSQRKLRQFFPQPMEPEKRELATPKLTKPRAKSVYRKQKPEAKKEEKYEEKKEAKKEEKKVAKKSSGERRIKKK